MLLKVASTDCCKLHKAKALILATELLANVTHKLERRLELSLHKRLVEGNLLDLGSKCCVTTVVAPICIEDTKLCLHRVTTLGLEVVNNLAQVVGIHSQTISLAVWCQLLLLHIAEALEHWHRLNLCRLSIAQHIKVLLARLNSVDIVLLDTSQNLRGYTGIKYENV